MGSSKPTPVPADIIERAKTDFPAATEANTVIEFVNSLHRDSSVINVGPSQFCRAILVLANGDFAEFNRLASIPEDPRDTIMAAEYTSGNPGHYFIPPFSEQ